MSPTGWSDVAGQSTGPSLDSYSALAPSDVSIGATFTLAPVVPPGPISWVETV